MLTVVAPASMTAVTTSTRKSHSVRDASSGLNSTSSVYRLARRTPSTLILTISSLARLSL